MTTLDSTRSPHTGGGIMDVLLCHPRSVPTLTVLLFLDTMEIKDPDLNVKMGLRIGQV